MKPSLDDQREVISDTIRTLRDSFKERIGEHKGRITDPVIVREIKCLRATRTILQHPLTSGLVFSAGLSYRHPADRRVIDDAIAGEALHADTIKLLTGKAAA